MKKRRLVAAAIAMTAIIAAYGANADGANSTPAGHDTTAGDGEPTFDEPVKIGVLMEQTGPLELLGKPAVIAAEAAVAEVNADGGIGGRDVELQVCDTQSDPQRALSCYQEVTGEGAKIVVGPYNTGAAQAIIPLSVRDEVLYYPLSGALVDEDVQDAPLAFMGNTSTEAVISAIYDWMRVEGYSSMATLTQSGASSEACKAALADPGPAGEGIEVFAPVDADPAAPTMVPQLAGLPGADVLFSCTSGAATLTSLSGWEEIGLSDTTVAVVPNSSQTDATARAITDKIPSGHLENVKVVAYCTVMLNASDSELSDPPACYDAAQEFADAVTAVDPGGASTDGLTASTWDAMRQVLEAAAAVGYEPADMASYIEGLEEWPGACGAYTFGPEKHRGLGAESLAVGRISDSVWVPDWTDNLT